MHGEQCIVKKNKSIEVTCCIVYQNSFIALPSTSRDFKFGVPIATCILSFSLCLQGADNLVREMALIVLGVLCNCEAIVSDSVLSTLTQPDCRSATYSIYHNMNDETGFMTATLPIPMPAPVGAPLELRGIKPKAKNKTRARHFGHPEERALAIPPSMAGRFYDHDICWLSLRPGAWPSYPSLIMFR